MDSPRRSARLAAKPRVDYSESEEADLNDYQRFTIHQTLYGTAPTYGVEACAGLIAMAAASFIIFFVASTSYSPTYSGGD